MIDNYVVVAVLFWVLIISLVAMITTLVDKSASRKPNKWRVPEKRLFFISLIGGSPAMLVTMILIRHKTKHKRFMIGLPLMIILQAALIVAVLRLYNYI